MPRGPVHWGAVQDLGVLAQTEDGGRRTDGQVDQEGGSPAEAERVRLGPDAAQDRAQGRALSTYPTRA